MYYNDVKMTKTVMPGEDMENEEKCKMISFQIPITCLETTKLDDRENDTIMSPKQSNH